MGSHSSQDDLQQGRPSPSFDWGFEGDTVSRDSFEPVPLFESNNCDGSVEAKNSSLGCSRQSSYGQGGTAGEPSGGKRAYDMYQQSTNELPSISRRKKKAKGMPKRPMSSYAIFFSRERNKILDSERGPSNLSFEDLERIIGTRWKGLTPDERKEYEDLASQDSVRYRTEMEHFNDEKKKNAEPHRPSKPEEIDDIVPLPPLHSASHYQRGPVFEETHRHRQSPPEHYSSNYHGYPTGPTNYHLPPITSGPYGRPNSNHVPPAYPVPVASMSRDVFPIPPGMELMLPDQSGVERKYRVEYTCYTMTREAAEEYINQLTNSRRGPQPPPHQPRHGNNSDSHGDTRPHWAGSY